ncbi:glycogen operon protein GlgX homolog [Streptomyces daqingensis]|uniref:Glycogen operon protein GlgX homolog n=1 Tax=Streptomyces daqingensis TaxID=1472640 RepID=A0ABQ2MTN6_9ACTN|nr:isoamylase [Streptomyces daqingensis]GGO57245.1 glycogen operon protein GlgX homolog [Streptomyces daqingensis]
MPTRMPPRRTLSHPAGKAASAALLCAALAVPALALPVGAGSSAPAASAATERGAAAQAAASRPAADGDRRDAASRDRTSGKRAADRLGATYDEAAGTIEFRVYSSRATRIDVYLYDEASGAQEKTSRQLTKDDDTDVWSVTVDAAELEAEHGIEGAVHYGYRAWGPNWPYDEAWKKGSDAGFRSDVDAEGNRFNPNKLLFDPYARELSHDPRTSAQNSEDVYATGPQHRTEDSGQQAPKGVVLAEDGTDTGTKPSGALKDDVLYEVHLRGLTKNDASVPEDERGTYRGAARKAAELAELGVTAVEFLPLQESQNDANDADPQDTADDNYWGYETLNFFAPDRRYAADRSPGGPTREFKAMVKAFHDAGIKVLADVVYNHAGEGGPYEEDDKDTYNLFSQRGLDNPAYYSLTADRQSPVDNTGVGGNVNTRGSASRQLIVDSLAYWKDELGVDGFRFDLAPVLGNTCEHECFRYDRDDPGTALSAVTEALPPRPAKGGPGTDLIAEPWALGEGTYQVGEFPAGWAEWNDQFRDTFRRDQNSMGSEEITPGQLATRLAGSSDLYGDDGRHPWNSVNFMVAHDGFTLADLYRCDKKDNGQPWPYGPSDGGSDNNISWDQGGGAAAQRQAARNGMTFQMLSAGTPMMTGGDEYLRSVKCNNNPYNLDSEANWLGHEPDADQRTFHTFTQRMIAFRKAHPALRPSGFYSDADGNGNGMPQLSWHTPEGAAPTEAYWNDPDKHALGWRLDGTELGDPADALYVAYNGWSEAVEFTLPSPGEGKKWHVVTDTDSAAEGEDQVASPGSEKPLGGEGTVHSVKGRSALVLIAR